MSPRATTVHRGRWTLADRLEQNLRELPFEVPPGTAAISVELTYDRSAGVLDLGCLGAAGFRGWSGGARDAYTITPNWATPGYLPGETEPGPWHVLLRLHRVPPGGLDYVVRITTSDTAPPQPERRDPPPVQRPPRRDLPEVDGMRWVAGDFHSHTVHSDGALTVGELAALAAGRGLDFLAVTDHNTVSHHPELGPTGERHGITLLPGQEVTTDTGHANVFGHTGWIDFRRPAGHWLAHAEKHGGVMSVNHPLGGDCSWRNPMPRPTRHAEVWHSKWGDRRSGGPLAWAMAWRPDVIAIGGSDFHEPSGPERPGEPTTWLLVSEESTAGLLGALDAGRTAVSAGPGAPLLLRLGDELLALGADGTALVRADGSRVPVRGDRALLPAAPGQHRLETYENEVIALCQ